MAEGVCADLLTNSYRAELVLSEQKKCSNPKLTYILKTLLQNLASLQAGMKLKI